MPKFYYFLFLNTPMFLITWWNVILYYPILNLLILFYTVIPGNDFGIAIILMTILTRLLIMPITKKQIVAQQKMQTLQPELDKIKERTKDDKEKQGKEIMEFYKENKVNPLASCLPLILQTVVMIALYIAFRNVLTQETIKGLYSFNSHPESINNISLGFLDVTKTFIQNGEFAVNTAYWPSIILALLAGGLQFIQSKMMQAKQAKEAPKKKKKKEEEGMGDSFQSALSTQMLYFFPLITVFIGATFPLGVTLYWITSTLFMIIQQRITMKKEA